jgi:hypothetical protein
MHTRIIAFQDINAWESKPIASHPIMKNPIRIMRPMSSITASFEQSLRPFGSFNLSSEKVDPRIWKIAQATRVVQVQMCQHNMPHIFRLIT